MERKIISRKRRLRSRRRLPGMAAPQKILAARPEAARNRRGARSRAVITAKSEQSRVGQTLACLTLSRSTESEINRSPDANARFDPDAPIMALDYLLDDGQANSNSAAEFLALVQPPEDAEDRLVMSLRNPYTVIADVKDRGVGGGEWGVVESERRRQGSAFFPFSLSPLPPPHPPLPILPSLFPSDLDPLQRLVVVFDRVDDQVVEDFAYARVVGSNYRQPLRATNLGAAFLQPRRDHLQRFADDVVEIDFMHGQVGSPDA